ncbi:Sir2 family NAD-dependent protein deacetylase, partial [Staphylococcus aureus]|uniref:Sir2 family NAD-dependent protein deacetylase n=1 Tax=Staphylococcus aureus TaxID=1280 RepID=UPI0028CB3F65
DSSNRITFFTGAAVSLATRVPHFPSIPPLFHQISKHPLSPQYFLTPHYLQHHPQPFINFSHNRLLFLHTIPNILHDSIPKLQPNQQSLRLITQNIDGFHSD